MGQSATQSQLAAAMKLSLQISAPDFSVSPGSPEDLIIQAFAAALANAEANLNAIQGGLDITSKTGDALDRFAADLGYARQQATQATGYVTFSVTTPPLQDIIIPANTQVMATITSAANTSGTPVSTIYFLTQFQGTIAANTDTSVTVPIIAKIAGSSGNVAANTITSFANTPVYGVTAVTNPLPTTGGQDSETDAEFQTRIGNTVFRNLAGTQDQYLGIIASTPYTTQAKVIGPVSQYTEYIQVPPVDDTQSYEFTNASGVNQYFTGNATVSGTYTTALSSNPNSQYTYTNLPAFITNGQTGTNTVFYREGIDWVLNVAPFSKDYGDAYRFWQAQLPGAPNPLSTDPPTVNQPNVTFMNVIPSDNQSVQAIQPEQVVQFQYSYCSASSRNNPNANLLNAVDVFINGVNNQTASTVLSAPGPAASEFAFTSIVGTPYYYQNFQRWGQPGVYPSTSGNIYLSLYQEPVTGLPAQITVNGTTQSGTQATTFYALGTHYWLVQDITELYGTVRCRNGIEFNPNINGNQTNANDMTGLPLTQYVQGTPIPINGYTYDQNIVNLQALCESAKQITTDVLIHENRTRYFKLDITVVYAPGSTPSVVNAAIQTAVASYFANQTFGALIQIASLIQVVISTVGVQNARWSADLPFGPEPGDYRITETDVNGNPIQEGLTLQIGQLAVVRPGFYNEDFFLADDELASLPIGALSTDTLPGLIIRARSEGSYIRGPFNPTINANLPVLLPD
jgi:uncharacterized phage protein gp47/JayE